MKSAEGSNDILGPVCPRGYVGIKFQIMRSDHSQMEQSREKPTDEVQGIVTAADSDSSSRWNIEAYTRVFACSHLKQ